MTTESQIINELQPFIEQITSASLPAIPGAGIDFYLEIEVIRCEAVNEICRAFLSRCDDAGPIRKALDSIRLDLLAIYPDCAALLDPVTWPNMRLH